VDYSIKAPPEWEAIYRRIRVDIFALCRLLKFEPTQQQVGLFTAVMAHEPRIAVKSGQGTGKTAASAMCALWRVIQAPRSLVVVTAPSMRQAQDVYMMEVRNLISQGPPFFQRLFFPTARKIYVGRGGKDDDSRPDWGIIAVTATDPRNAQGYHRDNLSFFVDESSGVGRGIIEQIEGTLSQNTGDFLHMHTGNPNTQDCAFYDFFTKKRKFWKTFTFDALSSPRVSKAHCAYMKEVYGERSDVYRVRVLGEFPSMDPNAIMSMDDLEACSKNDPLQCVRMSRTKQVGIDLARYGSDESVIAQRSGNAIVNFETFAKVDPNDVVKRAFVMQAESGWDDDECMYVADADGMGQGVMDRFHKAEKQIHEFHTSAEPSREDFHDRMSEAWFVLGRLVKARKVYLPADNDLLQQLATRIYEVTDKGKIKIESKKKYKERTEQPSPDRADAVVMAFYDGAVSQAKLSLGARSR
jgi:phage terminase large subunit